MPYGADTDDEDDHRPGDTIGTALEHQSRNLCEPKNEMPNDIGELPTNLQDGLWPCDECNCTYPLQQLLYLHKMQKHRQRNFQCNQCDK